MIITTNEDRATGNCPYHTYPRLLVVVVPDIHVQACFSRQQGRLHASHTYLQKALAIEKKLHKVDNPADTHLNLCAVLSQLNRHDDALVHAQSALQVSTDRCLSSFMANTEQMKAKPISCNQPLPH